MLLLRSLTSRNPQTLWRAGCYLDASAILFQIMYIAFIQDINFSLSKDTRVQRSGKK